MREVKRRKVRRAEKEKGENENGEGCRRKRKRLEFMKKAG